VISDEPPSRWGSDRGPSPPERALVALWACASVSAGRMAEKIRADVPVHDRAVRLRREIDSDEPDTRIERLAALVTRYSPVDSLIRAAVPDYTARWVRRQA
jgi:uncharacterized OsmC-like protein